MAEGVGGALLQDQEDNHGEDTQAGVQSYYNGGGQGDTTGWTLRQGGSKGGFRVSIIQSSGAVILQWMGVGGGQPWDGDSGLGVVKVAWGRGGRGLI